MSLGTLLRDYLLWSAVQCASRATRYAVSLVHVFRGGCFDSLDADGCSGVDGSVVPALIRKYLVSLLTIVIFDDIFV